MRVSILDRFGSRGLLVAGAAAVALAATPAGAAPEILEGIRVHRDGGELVLELPGVEEAAFTAFEMEEPRRLVVDLAGVRPEETTERIPVAAAGVEAVEVETFLTATGEPQTRLTLPLTGPVDYRIDAGGEDLAIRIARRAEELPAVSAAPAVDEVGQTEDPGAAAADAPAEEEVREPASPSTASGALLTDIEVDADAAGTVLRLRAEGRPEEIDAFTLADPDRLVLDLYGAESAIPSRIIPVGTRHVRQIRLGSHLDKLRVVLDAGGADEPFASHREAEIGGAIVIGVGAGERVAAAFGDSGGALAAADEPAEAAEAVLDVAAPGESDSPVIDESVILPEAFRLPDVAAEGPAEPAPWAARAAVPEAAGSEMRSPGAAPEAEPAPEAGAAAQMQDPAAATDEGALPEAEVSIAGPVASEARPDTGKAAEASSTETTAETAPVADAGMGDPVAAVIAGSPAPGTAGTESEEAGHAASAAAPVPADAEEKAAATDPADTNGQAATANGSPPVETTARAAAAGGSEPTASPRIVGVSVEREATRDRVVVTSDRPLSYELAEPDAETLILRFPGVDLAEGAAQHVAVEGEGAVALVSSFVQPETEGLETRVVVKRAAGAEPLLSRDGERLYVDFPGTGVSAAPPPAVRAAESTDPTAPPASVAEPSSVGLLAPGGFSQEKVYTGRRISLDFKDVDINDVLRLIADVSDLNIIAGDEVKGKVTIRLVDVPWDQALDVILLTKGLGFERVGNVLRIAPAEVLKQEEEARLQERRAKEKLEDLVVKLMPVNYADVKEVEKMVKRLLTERGTVNVDKRTNTVIIKDIPSVIDEATALVKSIDTQTPQVLIESKIVEASLDYSKELGSQWGFGYQPFVDPFDENSGDRRDNGSGDFRLHNEQRFFPGNSFGSNNVVVQNPITQAATGLLDIGAFLINERFNLELLLQAAESNGEGKVISSPRVVTMDNREATIEQGVSIPFQTFENGDAQLEFIDAVLSLKVTPHITKDKSIIMKIEVTRNAPDDSVQTPTGSPAIAKNQAKTETLVKDGQTLVIGGIYVVQKSDRRSSVPYLWKIPIIGHAFRNTEKRDIRKELLIFVTPRVVKNLDTAS